nr:hypothetical protein [Tanacetum cinerariifolium]
MEQPNPTFAKILILDTGKFEQWKFRIQEYRFASESSAKKKGRTVAITTEDMQKRRNDVKARTTLLLALPDEHQLRFNKYETAQELMAHVHYCVEKIDDLETLSLDNVYNHLKVYEPEVQKKSELNSQNMAFISLANTSSGKGHYSDDENDIEEIDIKWIMALLTNEEENHALVADEEALTEFALMVKSSASSENKKDMSWTGLPEFADNTIIDYSRPSPSIESNTSDLQNSNFSVSEHEESSESIMSKPMIKFVKA